jgi:hypothetical protein
MRPPLTPAGVLGSPRSTREDLDSEPPKARPRAFQGRTAFASARSASGSDMSHVSIEGVPSAFRVTANGLSRSHQAQLASPERAKALAKLAELGEHRAAVQARCAAELREIDADEGRWRAKLEVLERVPEPPPELQPQPHVLTPWPRRQSYDVQQPGAN